MKNIVNFIFEIQTLKNIKRSGSAIARVSNPDSIAEHVAIASQLAFILACLEKADAEKCACIILFHDNAEVRIGDINKINARYLDYKLAEKQANTEQIKALPSNLQTYLQQYFDEYNEQKTKEAQICKDADLLELAFQAKIFLEQGYHAKQDWLNNIKSVLKTSSGQALFQELENSNSADWWAKLKKIH